MAGPVWGGHRLQAGLEHALSFLGGFEDMGDRLVSALTVSSRWPDCGVIAKAIADFTTQGALCVLVKEGDAKAVLQGGTGEVRVPSKER